MMIHFKKKKKNEKTDDALQVMIKNRRVMVHFK